MDEPEPVVHDVQTYLDWTHVGGWGQWTQPHILLMALSPQKINPQTSHRAQPPGRQIITKFLL